MLRIAWVAAIALLLGAVNPSFASEGSPDDTTSTSTTAVDGNADDSNDGVADGSEEDSSPPAPPTSLENLDQPVSEQVMVDFMRRSDRTYATKQELETAMGSRVSQADFDAAIASLKTQYEQNSNWQGWHFGAMATVSGAVLTGVDESFVPIRVDGLVRHLSPYHIGFEATAGLGGWGTEDLFPFMFTTSVAFATGGAHWSASVGPEYSILQHPLEGMDAAHMVNLKFNGEYRPDNKENLMIRVFLSPNLYNEGKRSGGLQVGGSVGYHF